MPRFIEQTADNALRNRAPLSWLGAIETSEREGREVINLKLRGTALFVDAARLFALAHGLDASNTRQRLIAAARALRVGATDGQAWVAAFEFLQMLRLRVQLESSGDEARGRQ